MIIISVIDGALGLCRKADRPCSAPGRGFVAFVTRPAGRGVITSYSIHYTKLYDMPLADFGFAIGGSHVAQQTYKIAKLNCCSNTYTYYKLQRPLKYLQSGDDKLVHRITSYNVCYTKLLRLIMALVPEFIPGFRPKVKAIRLSLMVMVPELFSMP